MDHVMSTHAHDLENPFLRSEEPFPNDLELFYKVFVLDLENIPTLPGVLFKHYLKTLNCEKNIVTPPPPEIGK